MNKETYINELTELMQDYTELNGHNVYEIIYIIDGIKVYGGFDYGTRGIDHNILMFNGVTWGDILNWGVVVVPETQCYISNKRVLELDYIDYTQLPLNDNHIVGYKKNGAYL